MNWECSEGGRQAFNIFAKDFINGLLLYFHSLLKNQNYSSSPIFIPLIILFKHTELISFDSMNVSNQSFSACWKMTFSANIHRWIVNSSQPTCPKCKRMKISWSNFFCWEDNIQRFQTNIDNFQFFFFSQRDFFAGNKGGQNFLNNIFLI